MYINKIISGGQTGADRAALDFAILNGIPCGGWCPKGRRSEEGRIPEHYPLKETLSGNYEERTNLNICNSDGTLVFLTGHPDKGTVYTIDQCKAYSKPLFIRQAGAHSSSKEIRKWLMHYRISKLNFAGPREGESPGIYKKAMEFLESELKALCV